MWPSLAIVHHSATEKSSRRHYKWCTFMSALHRKEAAIRKFCIYFGWWAYTSANAMPIIYVKSTSNTCLFIMSARCLTKSSFWPPCKTGNYEQPVFFYDNQVRCGKAGFTVSDWDICLCQRLSNFVFICEAFPLYKILLLVCLVLSPVPGVS